MDRYCIAHFNFSASPNKTKPSIHLGLGKIILFYTKFAYALVNIFIESRFFMWNTYVIGLFAAFHEMGTRGHPVFIHHHGRLRFGRNSTPYYQYCLSNTHRFWEKPKKMGSSLVINL